MHRPQRVTSKPSRSRVLALQRWLGGPFLLRSGALAILEVPGIRTGTPRHFTIFPVEVEGVRYLVSQYGVSDWVRNLRAAGRARLRRKGVPEAVTAVEVFGAERDGAIALYLAKLGGLRRDYDALPDNADHPTFRIAPVE